MQGAVLDRVSARAVWAPPFVTNERQVAFSERLGEIHCPFGCSARRPIAPLVEGGAALASVGFLISEARVYSSSCADPPVDTPSEDRQKTSQIKKWWVDGA